ncbi:MAG: asparagine synthetase B family protein [Bacteroidetes bacterium]|nr:asparagine synthetase B family protein [Bacteroidota bacterium]
MIKNGIIPHIPVYYEVDTKKIISEKDYLSQDRNVDLKSLCLFAACGFFLDEDTHFEGVKALRPATEYKVEDGRIVHSNNYFQWYHQPQDISLKSATENFKEVFHQVVNRMASGKKVILPLSGGLDSRSLAAALKQYKGNVEAYSYEFDGGESETWYSEKIAGAEGFPFHAYKIEQGYLWDRIEQLGQLNNCTSEFTHPRQMAVIDQIEKLGNCFFLGHWGDVLFDGMGVNDDLIFDEQVEVLYKKVLKKGGKELGEKLWNQWGLTDTFAAYLKDKISTLLKDIKIDNANSRIRAFKSMYWAPRWTSSNMSIFRRNSSVAMPYYDDMMCDFICSIPESLLDGRQIQIEYLKTFAPELAKIKWQGYGLDLYRYQDFYKWHNLPNRIIEKAKRTFKSENKVSRNWELQFLGERNMDKMNGLIFDPSFNLFIDKDIVRQTKQKFLEDGVQYSHPLSILLTLSVFHQLRKK